MIKKRYLAYLSFALLVIFSFGMFNLPTVPVRPNIQLAGEIVFEWPGGRNFMGGLFGEGLTNTFIGYMLAWGLLVWLAVRLRARSRTSDEVPTGFYNFFEMIIEGAYGYVQNAAGKWAKTFFPFFMTFVLLILTANWLELLPGVDSLGWQEDLAHHRVEVAERQAELEGTVLTPKEKEGIEADAREEGGRFSGLFLLKTEEGEEAGKQVVPWVRAAATDLNFTVALALVSVVFTQVVGVRALGPGYFKKFWAFSEKKIVRGPFGMMDVAVGLLELISELSKILSFSFRLFGNIFAGQVLLFVIASLAPVANLGVYFLEFAVGAIQALVFGLLTLTFMTGATTAHHGDEH